MSAETAITAAPDTPVIELPVIELRGISKFYQMAGETFTALADIDLKVSRNDYLALIGPSGSGKSTLLNAISGDLFVDSGSLHIDEQDVTRVPAWQRAGMVARVFQDPMAGTCEGLSIEENMALAWHRGRSRGFGRAIRAEQRELFREKLAMLKLGLNSDAQLFDYLRNGQL